MDFNSMNKDPFNSGANYPAEIAESIIDLIGRADVVGYNGITDPEVISRELTDAIYYVRACAENRFNNDYWRVFYTALSELCNVNK